MTSTSSAKRRPQKASTGEALVLSPTPDEQLYASSLEAIRVRRDKVERLRSDIERLRQSLTRFESLCHTRVGDLVAELQRVVTAGRAAQSRLAAAVAATELEAEEILDVLLDGLDLERDLGGDVDAEGVPPSADPRAHLPNDGQGQPGRDDPVKRKRMYRELAKRCHPDLAGSAEERARRAGLMQRINEAFEDGDIQALRALLHETEANEPAFSKRTTADKLQWARVELARLDRQVAELRSELVRLHVGELYRLWRRHEAGEAIFDILEDDLERRIRREGLRLDRLAAAHRRLLEQQGTVVS